MAHNETKYMESVIALSEELNFTLAAQKVHVSQPVISRNIAELEAKLGGRLFDRDHRGVSKRGLGKKPLDSGREPAETRHETDVGNPYGDIPESLAKDSRS